MNYQQQIITAVKKVLPAVVSIAVAKNIEQIEAEMPFKMPGISPRDMAFLESKLRQAPRDEHGKIKLGGGSGFLISKEGLILTNKHVVMDPNADYTVITSDNERHKTAILARDPINDVAILKIKAKKNLPIVKMSASKKLELGQTVIAIGNALGEFQNSVSTGVVSGLSRFVSAVTDMAGHQERLRGLIQTDAAINPGNSGGPLIDLKGEAIGINAAVVFGAQNIGFAIPIEQAKKDLNEIKRYGRIRRPFLGIRYMLLNKQLQERFGLPIGQGALIINEGAPGDFAVIPKSAADKAGLKEFDVILSCNKKKITEKETLEDILSKHSIGESLQLKILRQGKKISKKVTLQEFHKV